ncbi:MAG: xanthine dehydrogenase family protein subunit M [Hyphomicrobiales bacterium]|nr:xanthine dehydrogenase family protein subunit M [Hyphomicrobiales bacterium]MCY4049843.1 xanthine dehydrogenase family protein subunit M [Hyphomicrobiales bacterium]
MYPFTYHKASSIEQAQALLDVSNDSKLLAGGQTLIPTLKQHLASPGTLVDIGKIESLRFVRVEKANVVIGAATPHAQVANDKNLVQKIPALASLVGKIGDPHVRNVGTIGGSVANNDPAADYPAACLALGATIRTDKRSISADDFFTGLFETALVEQEIIVEVAFPVPALAAYEKFPNPASRYALVGVFVAQVEAGVRVAVTGAGANGVFRMTEMESALVNDWSADALEGILPSVDSLLSDLHGAADYRAHLVNVMAKRAIAQTC